MRKRKGPKVRASADELEALRSNPEFFLDFYEGTKGQKRWPMQIEIMEALRDHTETLIASCHGAGKTYVAADVVPWRMLCWPNTLVLTAAPTGRQVDALLWTEIGRRYIGPQVGELTHLKWTFRENLAMGFAPKMDAKESELVARFQGFHAENPVVIFDEAPAMDRRMWGAKDGVMTGRGARFLGIGNPIVSSGSFYDAWRSKDTKKIKISVFDTPNFTANQVTSVDDLRRLTEVEAAKMPLPYPSLVDPVWAVRVLKRWGETSPYFKSRVLAIFPDQSDDDLISLAWLEVCAALELKAEGDKVLGIDVARFGDAETVLIGFHGHVQVYKKKYQGQDTVQTTGAAIELIRKGGYDTVVVDDDGVGGGVTDGLVSWVKAHRVKCAIIPFKGGGSPKDASLFVNLRAEAWWNAREMIKAKDVQLCNEDDLFHQLSNIKFDYSGRAGRIQVEGKDEMEKRGLPSPDEADACVMALWAARHDTAATFKKGLSQIRLGPQLEGSETPWGKWS